MSSRSEARKGRSLVRAAVIGAVALAAPLVASGTANAAPESAWDALAQCESGGNWGINTGNGFSGGLQFTPSTWRAFGGSGSAHNASRSEQIAVAERVLAGQGWGAWPSCSRKTGVRGHSASPGKTVTKKAAATKSKAAKSKVVKSAPKSKSAPKAMTKAGADYTVVAGDTLGTIARKHNIAGGWQSLHSRNADVLGSPDVLRVGQQLDLG